MKPLTEEWIDKAEGDYYTAFRKVNVPELYTIAITFYT